MTTAILAGLALFFAFTAAMLCQERLHLLNRARHAEVGERAALKVASDATEARGAVERDALALAAQNEQCREQIQRLTAHLHAELRRSSQLQSLQIGNVPTYDFSRVPPDNGAIRSAHLN